MSPGITSVEFNGRLAGALVAYTTTGGYSGATQEACQPMLYLIAQCNIKTRLGQALPGYSRPKLLSGAVR